jgi:adenylate kinase
MKKLFLIIGAPGSGKTTDASIIAEHSEGKIAHFSTGDLLRAEVASGSELGKTIDGFVSKGNLVPLEIVINTVLGAITSSDKQAVVIDGFPRSIEQMEALEKALEGNTAIELVSVVEADVSEDVARDRVIGRARGADDNHEVFNNRMKVYMEPIEAIREFYNKKMKLKVINAERTIEEIVTDMKAHIHSKL